MKMQVYLQILMLFFIPTKMSFANDDGSLNEFLYGDRREIIAEVKYKDYAVEINQLRSKDLEILGVNLKDKSIDLFLTEAEYKNLSESGFDISTKERLNSVLTPNAEYKTPDEIYTYLKHVNDSYPNITHLVSIGKSFEGRDIWAIKISDNASVDELEPTILFNSMHHAREIMTPEVGIDIIDQLVENYDRDEKITNWVNSKQIWVIPMLNVDGNQKVWNGSTMWRKNTRGGFGVDINRNYPYKWGTCNGSSGSRFSDTYRGASGGSEPETQALMDFVSKIRPIFDISFHSYSELVIYPYGCNGDRTPTAEVVENVGKIMASKINYTPGTAWETLYSVDGGDIDWMYAEYGVIPYVIEVNSSREGFQPNYKLWRDKTVTLVRSAWTYLLERMDQSAIYGVIASPTSNSKIEIYKEAKGGATLFQTIAPTKYGEFRAILNPGNYLVKLLSTEGRSIKEVHTQVANVPVSLNF